MERIAQLCEIPKLDRRIEVDAEDGGTFASMDERRGHSSAIDFFQLDSSEAVTGQVFLNGMPRLG